MNRAKTWSVLVVIALFCLSCSTVETNAYRGIGTITITVDNAMKAYGDAVRANKVPATTQEQVKAYYIKYQISMRIAKDVVNTYRKGGDRTQLDTAMLAVSEASGDLTNLINSFIGK